jgi:hypothetical protein
LVNELAGIFSGNPLSFSGLLPRGVDTSKQIDLPCNLLQWSVFRKSGDQVNDHLTIAHKETIDSKLKFGKQKAEKPKLKVESAKTKVEI